MFNKIILVGNLTRDIELRYSPAGMAIANTAIATSHKFTQNGEKKEEVCFIDITFFGRSAEIANQYLRKGSKILVEGRLKFDQWVDQNGQKRSKHSVIVANMQMLDSRGDGMAQQGFNQQPYNAPAQQSNQQQGYQQSSMQQDFAPNNQQSYQQPNYETPANDNMAQNQSRQMPSANEVPTIDIDEDEIPF